MDGPYVSLLERNKRNPGLRTLEKVAKVLQINPLVLLLEPTAEQMQQPLQQRIRAKQEVMGPAGPGRGRL